LHVLAMMWIAAYLPRHNDAAGVQCYAHRLLDRHVRRDTARLHHRTCGTGHVSTQQAGRRGAGSIHKGNCKIVMH
jgi:hypothetical protein